MNAPQESSPEYRYKATIDYVEAMHPVERSVAELQAAELFSQRGLLKDYVAIVPVAAHQEPLANVEQTLAQYARQKPLRPFTALLGLNHPNNEHDAARADRLIEQTRKLADEHRNLDVRVLHTSYDEPRIGRIRRDLWNTVILAGLHGGTLNDSHEMVGMNGDIDLLHMQRHVVADIQKYGDHILGGSNHQHVAPPFAVPMRHATSPEYPRSSAFITWRDYLAHIGYSQLEAAMVMPLGRYALHNGINPKARRSEMLDTLYDDDLTMYQRKLQTGMSVTSSRRLLERLPSATWATAWEEGSFDAHNAYREGLDHCADISWHRQTELLLGTAQDTILHVAQGALHDAPEVDGGIENAEAVGRFNASFDIRKRAASRMLSALFDEYQVNVMRGLINVELKKFIAAQQA